MPVPREKLSSIRPKSRFDAPGHKPDGALGQRELGIAEQSRRVRARLHAETFAGRAPAQGAVEGEIVRRQRLEASPALLAGEVLAVNSTGQLGSGMSSRGSVTWSTPRPLARAFSTLPATRDAGCGRRAGWSRGR